MGVCLLTSNQEGKSWGGPMSSMHTDSMCIWTLERTVSTSKHQVCLTLNCQGWEINIDVMIFNREATLRARNTDVVLFTCIVCFPLDVILACRLIRQHQSRCFVLRELWRKSPTMSRTYESAEQIMFLTPFLLVQMKVMSVLGVSVHTEGLLSLMYCNNRCSSGVLCKGYSEEAFPMLMVELLTTMHAAELWGQLVSPDDESAQHTKNMRADSNCSYAALEGEELLINQWTAMTKSTGPQAWTESYKIALFRTIWAIFSSPSPKILDNSQRTFWNEEITTSSPSFKSCGKPRDLASNQVPSIGKRCTLRSSEWFP